MSIEKEDFGLLRSSAEAEVVTKERLFKELDAEEWSWHHTKMIIVAGTGFMTDSYDNFIISLVVPMIGVLYFGSKSLPPVNDSWLKAASSYGNLCGQLLFGVLADVVGRKRIYGLEMVILIIGALGCAFCFGTASIDFITSLSLWRFLLGIGVGGDYPVSAVIASEFASTKKRGTMIALVFAMQGVGILLGAIVTLIVLEFYKQSILSDYSNLNYVWRIIMGFAVVPCFLTIYFRFTMHESSRYKINVENDTENAAKDLDMNERNSISLASFSITPENLDDASIPSAPIPLKRKDYCSGFTEHFGKWSNAKILLATSICWLLLDIGYYGTNLNTSVILSAINYTPSISAPCSSAIAANATTGTLASPASGLNCLHSDSIYSASVYNFMYQNTLGTLIVALAGNVPGYFFTVCFIDLWGRKPIQFMGFMMLTLTFFIMATAYPQLSNTHGITNTWGKPLFFFIYTVTQFFFNFGPNSTTFIIPAEVFPTKVRSSAHGISAATGKMGAIIAAQGFSYIVDFGGPVGGKAFMQQTLGIFTVMMFLGFCFTFLLPETKNISLEVLGGENREIEMKEASYL